MADKKKTKKKKEEYPGMDKEVEEKPAKLEYTIAKWLKDNVPSKKIKFMNHYVEYFTGSKAVDALLGSKWASGDNAVFTERPQVVHFLHQMLVHKFFHRAKKVPVSEKELKRNKKKDAEKDESKKKATESQTEDKEKDKEDNKDKEQRKKRIIRLEIHMEQEFVDGSEVYVWMYDPIPFYYWIIGGLLVLGAIGVCMFPLWPPAVRKGVYYLSVVAAVFLALIIALTTLRFIIFCLVWAVSLSKHHFWILPNLTADVGFFASFWPLYHYEYRGADYKKSDKKKKKKKAKYSDEEPDNDDINSSVTTPLLKKGSNRESQEDLDSGEKSQDDNEKSQSQQENTESESEGSQRSSTGKDFEIVDAGDVDSS